MTSLNRLLTTVVDAVMEPMRTAPPLVSLGLFSLMTAAGMLLVVKWTANRRTIETAKSQMQAAIFEMRLFNDDLPAVLRAALEVGRRNVTYLRVWLLPLVILSIPLMPLMAQLEAFYAHSGFRPGQPVLLAVDVSDAAGISRPPNVSLDAPPEIDVQSPAIWFPAARELVWRISPRTTGPFELRLRTPTATFTKTLQVSTELARRSPVRVRAGFVNELLYPSEPPIENGDPVASISVDYPANELAIFSWRVPWLVPYFGLSLLFALALKRPFGVVF